MIHKISKFFILASFPHSLFILKEILMYTQSVWVKKNITRVPKIAQLKEIRIYASELFSVTDD